MGYKSITDPGKTNRMGGTKQFVLLAAFGDFTLIQQPAAGGYKVTAPHTFPVGKGFFKLYVTKDTGQVKFTTQGGPDRNSFVAEGEFYHPGEADDIESFANQAKNDRFVMLVPVPGTDEYIQLGGNDFQVQIMPEYDTTKNSGDGRGWLFKMSCFQADKIKYTAATVPMQTEV